MCGTMKNLQHLMICLQSVMDKIIETRHQILVRVSVSLLMLKSYACLYITKSFKESSITVESICLSPIYTGMIYFNLSNPQHICFSPFPVFLGDLPLLMPAACLVLTVCLAVSLTFSLSCALTLFWTGFPPSSALKCHFPSCLLCVRGCGKLSFPPLSPLMPLYYNSFRPPVILPSWDSTQGTREYSLLSHIQQTHMLSRCAVH